MFWCSVWWAVLPFPEATGSALSNTTRRPSRLDMGAPRSRGSVSPLCQNTTQSFSSLHAHRGHMAPQICPVYIHDIYTKVCGHLFKWVDSAISATPIADRCIKSSTQPCNLHRQTLSVEWPYWRAQWLSTWHRHRTPPIQQVTSSNLCPARAALVNCTGCYWEGVTMAQLRSGGHKTSQNWIVKCWSA